MCRLCREIWSCFYIFYTFLYGYSTVVLLTCFFLCFFFFFCYSIIKKWCIFLVFLKTVFKEDNRKKCQLCFLGINLWKNYLKTSLLIFRLSIIIVCQHKTVYSKTCVRQPPLKLTLVVDVERWLSYKGTCHVILLAKLHDMYLYKTNNFFPHQPLFKVSLEGGSLTQVLL